MQKANIPVKLLNYPGYSFLIGLLFLLGSCSGVIVQPTEKNSQDHQNLASSYDSVSYAWGVNIGNFLEGYYYDSLNFDLMANGMKDYMMNKHNVKIAYEDGRSMIAQYGEIVKQNRAEKNKKEGAEFLAENAKKDSVVCLPSGLQYKILTQGKGAIPREGDRVKCAYTGYLPDGTVFDSAGASKPFEFALGAGQVIPGWEEILKLMPIDSKWRVFIPSELGYGDNPRASTKIQPGMTLIFDIELLYLQPAQ